MPDENVTQRKTLTPSAAAAMWIKRGYYPVPIPYREKRPIGNEWQNLRITHAEIPQYFNGHKQNIGVLLGDDHNHIDIDLDCPEALALAHRFLPDTGLIFGRKSNPASHWFYRASVPLKGRRFVDP